MAVLKNTTLDAAFSQDPTISLKEYISDNYTIGTPAKADVNFDTKFARWDKQNHIIVQNLTKLTKVQTLGAGRFRYDEVKRVQIMCTGSSGKNNLYLIEQHIEDLINANITALQSDGIDEMLISDFTPIQHVDDAKIKGQEATFDNIARSFATVHLYYEKYVS